MTTFEIVQMYKEAADKNAQIKILADMNLCTPEDILLVLQNEGVLSGMKAKKKAPSETRMTWTDEAKEQVRKLLTEGLTVLEVSERMGLDYSQVRNAITRFKLGKGQSAKCKVQNIEATHHQSAALTASPQGETRESAEDKVEPLGVVSLIRDYAKCIASLPSADIRNYEKIVRTFAESIMEGADSIIKEGERYGV